MYYNMYVVVPHFSLVLRVINAKNAKNTEKVEKNIL